MLKKSLSGSPFKNPKCEEQKKLSGHVLCPAPTGCGYATFSICRPGNRIKVEAYLFIRESLNFLQRRSNWEFFNGLLKIPHIPGLAVQTARIRGKESDQSGGRLFRGHQLSLLLPRSKYGLELLGRAAL